jgi:hypothetical protein
MDGEESPRPKNVLSEPHRLPNNLLIDFPVDLLTVKRGNETKPPLTYERDSWEKLVSRTPADKQPQVVIESWPPNAQLWTKGPTCKSTTTRWEDLNYVLRYKRVSATNVGGAINQARLLVARVRHDWSHLWIWNAEETEIDSVRPVSNLLTPPGLVGSHKYVTGRSGDPVAFL